MKILIKNRLTEKRIIKDFVSLEEAKETVKIMCMKSRYKFKHFYITVEMTEMLEDFEVTYHASASACKFDMIHKDGRKEFKIGYHEMISKYNLYTSNFSALIHKHIKRTKGWTIVKIYE